MGLFVNYCYYPGESIGVYSLLGLTENPMKISGGKVQYEKGLQSHTNY